MKADRWISVRVDEHTLNRLNDLGREFGSRSQFVLFALRLASDLAATDGILGLNPDCPESLDGCLQNGHDPACKPGRAETSCLGRASEVAKG